VIVDRGLEVLSEEDSARLLAAGVVGRIGVTVGALPAIFPVNYRVVDGVILFRTTRESTLAAAAHGAVVAFEVDDYELMDRSGWSVLAVGQAEVIDDDPSVPMMAGPRPMVAGVHHALVRIVPTFLTGRRIAHEIGAADPLGS
jgi:hypothetical protein